MKRSEFKNGGIVIYKTAKGPGIQVKLEKDTVWLDAHLIAKVFGVNRPAIVKHINNIYKTSELDQISTCSKMEQVATDGKKRKMNFYNLDMIIAVGYRVNSKNATQFRIWATNILKQHFVKGYTINKKQLAKNYDAFLRAVEGVKKLLPADNRVGASDTIELIKMFASTWFSLSAYDEETLPRKGATKKQVNITADHLIGALEKFKSELIPKKEIGGLFGKERREGNIAGIVGNVFQSFGGDDLYPTAEEKSAQLLYFMVKNHPFFDGNKRSGAFAFVWFLQNTQILDEKRLTPEALTALTLLVAESNPKDKDKMIGLILMILK